MPATPLCPPSKASRRPACSSLTRSIGPVLTSPPPPARAQAGQRIDELLDEIAELQRMIDTSPAETLEDAAVKLRRLGPYIESGVPARLLAGALAAVERVANGTQP